MAKRGRPPKAVNKFFIVGDTAGLVLTDAKGWVCAIALIDVEDLDLALTRRWGIGAQKHVNATGGARLSRLIFGCRPGNNLRVRYKNDNSLDLRKSNMEVLDQGSYMQKCKIKKTNKTGYKGVCWIESEQKYRASIGVDYETILLGHFNVKEDAARAYNEAALKYFGRNAWLNKLP